MSFDFDTDRLQERKCQTDLKHILEAKMTKEFPNLDKLGKFTSHYIEHR